MFILPEYVHWESLEVSSRQEGKHLSYAVSLGRAEKMLKMLLVWFGFYAKFSKNI